MNNDIRTEEQETVSGIVDSIIYQNEDNGYVVFEMMDTSGYRHRHGPLYRISPTETS